jgi:serralysin
MAVYGDTSGILRDHEQALHQDIALPGGNDTIVGGNGRANSLTGDAQQMTDHAEGGDDMLTSNSGGASALFGDAQAMSGSARGGNDTLIGSNLISFGDMYGDARALADNSVGGNGVLISGRGIDHMWGDAAVVAAAAVTGADTFVFAPGRRARRHQRFPAERRRSDRRQRLGH